MKGNQIIVSADPMGKFKEGTVSGTPKPGTIMSLQSTAFTNGRPTWAAFNPGTGDASKGLMAVLLEDTEQGKGWDDAYVSGTRCRLYVPEVGEELNLRKADITGTGSPTEAIAIAAKLLVVDGTGKISPVAVGVLTTGVQSYPFQAMEAIVNASAPQLSEELIWCVYVGT